MFCFCIRFARLTLNRSLGGTTGIVEAQAFAFGTMMGFLALVALTVGALTVGTFGLAPVRVLAEAMALQNLTSE